MMKKTLALIGAAVMAAAVMAGCSNKKATETSAAPTVTEESKTEASTEETSEAAMKEDQAEFVVAGGDGAGLIAAIQAVKEGTDPSKVVILEKSGELGTDIASMEGFINAANTDEQYDEDIEDSFETFLADILKSGNNKNDEELAEFVAESGEAVLEWLRDMGIEMDGVTKEAGSSVARSYKAAGKTELQTALHDLLLKELETLKINVEYDTTVDEIFFSEDGGVAGLKVTGKDGEKTILCDALLVTDGELLPLFQEAPVSFTKDADGKITGLLVNNCAEVVEADGDVVPGLYAAGAVIDEAVFGEAALAGNKMTGMVLFGTTAGTEASMYAVDHK